MISHIYVSRSLVHPADRALALDDIKLVSIARNTMLGITGLLIASPDYFAHLLEGPVLGVAAVLAKITTDPRHTEFNVVRQSSVEKPKCPRWQMVRFDCDNFGKTVIDPLLMAAHSGAAMAVRRLERLIDTVTLDDAIVRDTGTRQYM